MKRRDLFTKPDREQVPFNLSAPAITGKPFQAGQYSVAVQDPVPASQTSLGKLAATLGQINPAIKAYGQAQQAETALQKTTVGLHYSAMDEQEKKAYAAQLATKEKINSRFRGKDYETNPVATLYAKELIGADLVDDFQSLVERRKEQFIQERVRDFGNKPSPVEINQFTGGLLNEFKALPENEGVFKDALILDGFMRASAPVRNKLNVTLPTQAAGIHKAEVVIPKAASSLVRSVNIDSEEIEDPGVLASRIKEAWASTGSLNSPEQRAVIAMALNSFPPTLDGISDAEEFVEAISSAGISIGTQPLDAEDEEGFVYNELLEELSDKKIKIEQRLDRQYTRLTTKTLRETKAEANKMMASPDMTRAEINEWIDGKKEALLDVTDTLERDALMKSYELLEAYLGTKQDEDVKELFRGVPPDEVSTPMFSDDLETDLQDILSAAIADIEGKPGYNYLLQQYGRFMFPADEDLEGGAIARQLTPKGRQLLINPKIKFNREVRALSEKIASALPGAQFEYKDFAPVIIPETGYEEFKQTLFTKIFSKRREELRIESQENLKAMLEKDKNRLSQLKEAQDLKKAEETRLAELPDRIEAHKARLDVSGSSRSQWDPYSNKRYTIEQSVKLTGTAIPTEVDGEWDWFGNLAGDINNWGFAETRTAAQVDTFYKALEDGFDLGAYDGEKEGEPGRKAGIIVEHFKNHFNNPLIKNRLKEELAFFKEMQGVNETHRTSLKLVEDTMKNGRRITGFSPEEAVQALETGYLSEGASLGADKFAYFNGLLGEATGGRATIKLNYNPAWTKWELKPLANKLGTTVEALHSAQQKLENRYKGIKKASVPELETQSTSTRPVSLEREKGIVEPVKKGQTQFTDEPPTVPTVPTMEDVEGINNEAAKEGDVKVDTKVSTTKPPEPEDVKVGTRISRTEQEQLQLPLEPQKPSTNTITIPKDSKIGKPIQKLKSSFEKAGSKYNVDPAFLMAIAIMETGHGKSSAFRNKRNAMGVTDKKTVRTFTNVEDSINHMAKTLANPNGPYKGLTTVDEIAKEYSPVGADNDVNGTNNQWPKIVKKLMKQLNREDVDNLTVVTRSPKK